MYPRKKILLINNSALISGAEHSLIGMLPFLTQVHDVTVVIPAKGELYERLLPLTNVLVVPIERIRSGRNPLQLFIRGAKLLKTAGQLAKTVKQQQIDIIYANTVQAHVYAMLIKLLTGKPIIWHVRDNINSKLQAWVLSINTNRIIAISRHISRQFPSGRAVQLVYNGIDTTLWQKANKNNAPGLREVLGISTDKIIIAHIGQFVPWKRHELFIAMAASLSKDCPDAHFVLIGQDHFNCHADYVKRLLSDVQHATLTSCFSILPYNSSLRRYLTDVDVLVHLAQREPFGRVIVEAMAFSIPVVVFAGGGPEEIVLDGSTGFVVPNGDLAQVAQKVKLLADDTELRLTLGENGRKHVVENFPAGNFKKVLDVIVSIDV